MMTNIYPHDSVDKPDGDDFLTVCSLTHYELWEISMGLAGKWVPRMGETIYVPYDDDIDCWEEIWDGNVDQRELAEQELVFPTANDAVARARLDREVILYAGS